MASANDMARFLPKTIRVMKTPDFIYPNDDGVAVALDVETVELRTVDIINAFMSLKETAMAEAHRIKSERGRYLAISKIKEMAFFGH